MFYQAQNLLSANQLKIERGVNFSFPPHLHGSFELITVTEGRLTVAVDGTRYRLEKGYALLIFPNQVHEFIAEESSHHFLCIFSPSLVQAFSKVRLSQVPDSNLFSPDSFYLDKLQSLDEKAGVAEVKGLLYSLCGEFDKGAAYYAKRKKESDGLLPRIFHFVENNYGADCSLSALSSDTSYNYVYLSRYFKERTGIPYTEYVNRYRINQACYFIGNTEKNMLNIAFECGFDSLRSFNRNFARIMGITPGEYRRSTHPRLENQ